MSEPSRPFTIRFSQRELALIRQYAPDEPVGRTIRQCVFQVMASEERTQQSTLPASKIEVASFLGSLGVSGIALTLTSIKDELELAGLETDQPVLGELTDSCKDIREMKHACIRYLGVRRRS